jgi:hypothetical protein
MRRTLHVSPVAAWHCFSCRTLAWFGASKLTLALTSPSIPKHMKYLLGHSSYLQYWMYWSSGELFAMSLLLARAAVHDGEDSCKRTYDFCVAPRCIQPLWTVA